MEKITKQDMDNISVGAAFLGSGGGGSLEEGSKISKKIFEIVDHIKIVKPEEVQGKITVSAGMGSPAVSKGKKWRNENVLAVEKLEEIAGEKISYIIPLEIGAGNLAIPMHTAAKKISQ